MRDQAVAQGHGEAAQAQPPVPGDPGPGDSPGEAQGGPDEPRAPHGWRVEGEFTGSEIESERRTLGYAANRLSNAERLLDQRRAFLRDPKQQAALTALREALADSGFMDLVVRRDRASRHQDEVKAALNRCSSRYSTRQTERAATLQSQVNAAAQAFAVADERMRAAMEERGVRWPDTGGQRSMEHAFRFTLGRWEQELRVEEAEQEVERAKRDVAKHEERVRLMELHAVPDRKLEIFARILTHKQRLLLRRLVTEGYEPRPKTIAKDPDFGVLVKLGLMAERGLSLTKTDLGQDVVCWVNSMLEGEGAPLDETPAVDQHEIALAFTPEQRQAMIARASAALKGAVKREDPVPIELGLPDEGFSYRVPQTIRALQRFLRNLGAHRHQKPAQGARVRRWKVPTYTPGRLIPIPNTEGTA